MSSNNFELHAKADEWMDVTPKEELLQNEVDRLKEAFDKAATQLDACRLENDLLKGFKTNLEQETQQLKHSLEDAHTQIESKTKEWEELNGWTSERIKSYQVTIREQEQTKGELEQQKATLVASVESTTQKNAESGQRYQALLQKAEEEKQTLQQKLATLQADNQQQHDTITRFYKDLEASRLNEQQLQKQLAEAKDTIEKLRASTSASKKDTGTIATLAQSLKAEKMALERSLTSTKMSLETIKSQDAQRTQQLAILREQFQMLQESSSHKVEELQTVVQQQALQLSDAKEDLQDMQEKLHVLEEECVTLQNDNAELTAHMSRMEAGRHEWLEQKAELEECVEETFRDLESANERLKELEESLEECELQRASLEARHSTFSQAADREAALQLQMEEQRAAFEERLNEIRGILGLKFTVAFSQGVGHKLRNVEMPVSFRVPLLAQKIV